MYKDTENAEEKGRSGEMDSNPLLLCTNNMTLLSNQKNMKKS
jgi:hypothetical protein